MAYLYTPKQPFGLTCSFIPAFLSPIRGIYPRLAVETQSSITAQPTTVGQQVESMAYPPWN